MSRVVNTAPRRRAMNHTGITFWARSVSGGWSRTRLRTRTPAATTALGRGRGIGVHRVMRRLRARGSVAGRDEPCVEVDRSDARAVARPELAALQLRSVVPRVRIADDRAVVADGAEQAPRPGVEAERLGAAELDAAAGRRAHRQLGDGCGDVLGPDELHQPRREADALALGAR